MSDQLSFFDTDAHVNQIAAHAGYDPDKHGAMLATLGEGKPPVSLKGYRVPLAIKHLQWHCEQHAPRNPKHRDRRMCSVDCMARAMYQVSTSAHRQKIRERVPKLMNLCLQWGMFLIVHYEPRAAGLRHRIVSMKIAQRSDHYACDEQLRRMQRRQELTAQRAALARSIVEAMEIGSHVLVDA